MKEEILFSKNHIWVCKQNDIVKVGISDYAQEKIGSIMFLNLPEEGQRLEIGESFGDIESIKTVSDLISPVSGEVLRVNEELVDEPDQINEEPYQSWFVEVKAECIEDDLMDEETYLKCRETI